MRKDKCYIKDIVHYDNSAYNVPAGIGVIREFGDAILHVIDNYSTPAFSTISGTPWFPSALEGYVNPLNATALSYIQIPDFQNLSPAVKSRLVLMVPKVFDATGDIVYPAYGYYYDPITSTVQYTTFADEDALEDQTMWYIWYVDYAMTATPQPVGSTSCDIPVVCGDYMCDRSCGESWPSCIDCDPTANMHLYLTRIAVRTDYKIRSSCAGGDINTKRWRENIGNYEVGVVGLIEHPNAKRTYLASTVDVPRSNIRLCKSAVFCGSHNCNNGGSTLIPVFDDLSITQQFHPDRSTLYIAFYEVDLPNVGPLDRWDYKLNLNITGRWSKEWTISSRHTPFGNTILAPKTFVLKNSGSTVYETQNPAPLAPFTLNHFQQIDPFDWTILPNGHYQITIYMEELIYTLECF